MSHARAKFVATKFVSRDKVSDANDVIYFSTGSFSDHTISRLTVANVLAARWAEELSVVKM
jgi:hypothetical protein